MSTLIEWATEVWNPVTGCTPVSAGCANCYAERMAKRLAGRYGYPKREPFKVTLHPDRLNEPFHWRKPRLVFVCSMGDLFHEEVPAALIGQVLAVCALAREHTFMCLTKRPERMLRVIEHMRADEDFQGDVGDALEDAGLAGEWDGDLPNVWLGVSVENQKAADERIPLLLQTPAAVRFVSVEPMLGAVDLSTSYRMAGTPSAESHAFWLDWVICGGESGPGARPMHPDWARGLRDQCVQAGVPFFFKQWGEYLHAASLVVAPDKAQPRPFPALGSPRCLYDFDSVAAGQSGRSTLTWLPVPWGPFARVGKKLAGRVLDGRVWEELPENGT